MRLTVESPKPPFVHAQFAPHQHSVRLVKQVPGEFTKNGHFQLPSAFHRSEADRPFCRPDRHSTHHQTADTSHASRLSGVSMHWYQ
jgi:hypothetical protein